MHICVNLVFFSGISSCERQNFDKMKSQLSFVDCFKRPSHGKLKLANSCWQTQVGVCERHKNSRQTRFYLTPTVCKRVCCLFLCRSHTPTWVCQHAFPNLSLPCEGRFSGLILPEVTIESWSTTRKSFNFPVNLAWKHAMFTIFFSHARSVIVIHLSFLPLMIMIRKIACFIVTVIKPFK